MTTDQPKPAPAQDHQFPPIVPYPQHYNGAPFPPPGQPGGPYPPSFFAYPPGDAENGQPGAPSGTPYMVPYPPHGMLYAYPPPPPGQTFPQPQNTQVPALRPKRKQVKMACTNCAAACKRCDETRPCERCVKYGISDTCRDGQRKERKKGIKRGPYKRKNKGSSADGNNGQYGAQPEGEWAPGTQAPASAATTTAAIHAVAHQFAGPEGYYPVYYPSAPYMPHPPEGQEGAPPPPANGQPPLMPYFIPAGAYPPPFPHYLPPGSAYPPPLQPPQAPPPPHSQAQETAKEAAPASGEQNHTRLLRPWLLLLSQRSVDPKMKKQKTTSGRSKVSKTDDGTEASSVIA
ncbi:hypothetical protein BD779DRAFT_1523977 [Infundibulicybe gibba]|nr:hypothetical protein BD779DRAFT_1523977 [Infundibulicybe gibba]